MGKIMVLFFEDPQDEFIKSILDLIGEDQHDFTLIEPTLINRTFCTHFFSKTSWMGSKPKADL